MSRRNDLHRVETSSIEHFVWTLFFEMKHALLFSSVNLELQYQIDLNNSPKWISKMNTIDVGIALALIQDFGIMT